MLARLTAPARSHSPALYSGACQALKLNAGGVPACTPLRHNSLAPSSVRPRLTCVQAMAYSVHGPGADQLRAQSCNGACSRDTPKVTPQELPGLMKSLPAWHVNSEGTMISRSFVAKNFVAAVKFFNKVADIAEREGHHPDLHLTNFREVQVNIQTHAIGGISMADLVLAAQLDTIEVEYSPKWVKQQEEKEQATAAAAL